ncbi:glutamine amidotransferase-related protein [Antarcticirhabdus aurantiaca]|uniref:Gamma-glutamyl-gamma-aminobutyrate hydrolase family protein n=1 Tax=Antarcticirhabdus aurantiaca TaxID=2606717 RepID=A0ACD4NK70_9HYPH|nr:gamma-glutamyl-gamma-aminobutyrate hydrolase family protein [Antarcticirhabdus aurantiaca]WAJ27186.1 gamma-glutamyl-gamma-aminobutyrate hydrolase family protein [Jeongeuplla avenae]
MPLNLLVVASETPDQCEARRRSVGAASHETFASTLASLDPEATMSHLSCVDGTPTPMAAALQRFDGVFFAGSPIQMHEESAETRSAADFAARIFEAGVPAFGSCAGLQIATVAAGGTCKAREGTMEAGFARGIVATPAGRSHPLLRGRPLVWEAPAMHSSMVEAMPPGGTVLASTKTTPVEAAEIRSGNGVFWGVQYHPELTIAEIAASLRRQSDDLMEQGMARDRSAVEAYARALEALHEDAGRLDIAWQIGVDEEVTDPDRRMRELRNFLTLISST